MCDTMVNGVKCGYVTIRGTLAMCESCEAENLKLYPQGWRHVPGDLCEHGNYVGNAYGRDYLCGRCEDGDDAPHAIDNGDGTASFRGKLVGMGQ